MHRRHPVLEETLVATTALAVLAAVIALLFWKATGVSPWPGVVLCELVAACWGLILVVLTSPSRRR